MKKLKLSPIELVCCQMVRLPWLLPMVTWSLSVSAWNRLVPEASWTWKAVVELELAADWIKVSLLDVRPWLKLAWPPKVVCS